MKTINRRYKFPDGESYPIFESDKAGILLLVGKEDVKKATRKDPENCALACCAKRMGADRAFIAGTVAYLVMTYRGKKVAVKYSVPESTQKKIKDFDDTGVMPQEGFMLTPLENGRKAENKKMYNARRSPQQRKAWKETRKGNREGARDLRTFRHLTGQVTTEVE